MIGRIVALALHQPLMMVLALTIFVGGGVIAFQNLPVEAFPDVSDIQATVITLDPGRAAEEVEKQVTVPLEIALTGLPHAAVMFSHTQFGLSYITITFDDNTTDLLVRQQVLERLGAADLPQGIQPTLQPLSTAIGEIYRFTLDDPSRSSLELRTLEDWVVEKQLRQVPGVAAVNTIGGRIKEYQVTPDFARMRDASVTLAQMYAALQRANANAGGGAVAQGRQQFLVRGIGLLRNLDDIGDVVIASNRGVPVRVRDVAAVRIGGAPQQGLVGQDGNDDVVTGIVVMRKGENPSRVLDGVHAKVDELNGTILPKGVKLKPYYDRTWLIGTTLHTVFHNLLEGALLVVIVLYLFLSDVRAAVIVASVIPLALLSTFLGLTFVGIPANLLSLGAMDFGILVDGAVIVVENIFRRLSEPHGPDEYKSRRDIILEAATEVGRPTLFSMIIIIAAHIPIFTLQRHEGRIFSPMAWSVSSALVGSLIVSLTLIPLLCWLFLPKHIPHGDNRLVVWCKNRYVPVLDWALERRRIVLGIALLGLAGALVIGSQLGSEFLPQLDEGSLWVHVTLPPSVSLDETGDVVHRVRDALHRVPEVNTVISKAGRPDDGTDPKLLNAVEIFVDLKPESQWRPGYDKKRLIAAMEHEIDTLPGIDPGFSQPIRDNVLQSISQIDGEIVIKIFGDDLAVLATKAREVLDLIRTVPGVALAAIDREGTLPQYLLEIDRAAAARYGLNVADVQDVVETAIAGKGATELYEGERHFSVVTRLDDRSRALSSLHKVLIATPDGAQIPLDDVVSFRATSGAMDISRENGQRVASVGIFIHDRDMGSVVRDMQAAVGAKVRLPEGYRMSWSGEFENQQRAMKRLAVVVPLSILVIFVLLFNAFGSLKSAGLIIANIPFAMIGGIVALALTGIPLSVSAAIGFIALFGQAVLNGVVLVSHFEQLRAEGLEPREAVRIGALTRLRTVLMTALLAMLGLAPMALSTAIGAETQRPLAIVVIGGLVSATLLTLIVLPTLYLALNGRQNQTKVADS
ncbi:MAG: CusA/CzcA family heavy metal efflux RND transporter [Nevskia sp.]